LPEFGQGGAFLYDFLGATQLILVSLLFEWKNKTVK
jgi:hypothetical protein